MWRSRVKGSGRQQDPFGETQGFGDRGSAGSRRIQGIQGEIRDFSGAEICEQPGSLGFRGNMGLAMRDSGMAGDRGITGSQDSQNQSSEAIKEIKASRISGMAGDRGTTGSQDSRKSKASRDWRKSGFRDGRRDGRTT